jgi:hypothetical protein
MKPIPKPLLWGTYTFSKKISIYKQYLGEYHAQYVDKLSAKKIASDYGVQVAPLIRILESPDDITKDDLKTGWILKASHGSGWNIILNEDLDIKKIKQTLHSWNKTFDANNERQYKSILPRFFIEEIITDKYLKQSGSFSYLIRCIYGNPIPNIRVRTFDGKVNSYDLNWKQIDPPQIPIQIGKPKRLNEMIELAKKMSKQFEFVRMDFYIGENDVIYFSEYTFTPSAGYAIKSRQTEQFDSAYWPRF